MKENSRWLILVQASVGFIAVYLASQIYSFFQDPQNSPDPILSGFLLILCVTALIGLQLRKTWSRYLCAVLFLCWSFWWIYANQTAFHKLFWKYLFVEGSLWEIATAILLPAFILLLLVECCWLVFFWSARKELSN